MAEHRCKKSLIIVLVSLFSIQAFSQFVNYRDSLAGYTFQKENLKPAMHYSLGSTFMFVPHLGTVMGYTFSPYLSVPLSPKLSLDGGIIAGRYYSSFGNTHPESMISGEFNDLSIFGSASYHINSQLTLYGTAIKQLAGTSPFSSLQKSSYTVGSTFRFGNFSIGASLQTSRWNDNSSSNPFVGTQGFYPTYEQRPGTAATFGR